MLKFVPKGPTINNKQELIQIMAMHWAGISSFNSLRPSDAYICIDKLTIIDSDNGLSPGQHQVIIWTDAGILLIGPLGTNFNEILIGIETFSFKKMHLKMSSAKWRPLCLGLNVFSEPVVA